MPEPWEKEFQEQAHYASGGAVIDVGAGTCILSAQLSRLPEVSQVFVLDLSEEFLTTTGLRMLRQASADESKLTFVASAAIRGRRRRALALGEETTEIAYTLDELRYVIDYANIGACNVHIWDVLSRPGPRRWIRAIARWAGLEHVLLAPPNYLFVNTRH